MRVAVRVLRAGDTDHELLWALVGLAALGAASLILAAGVPVVVPACVFKGLTGWPCPTCGTTRALLALAAADPRAAFGFNPLAAAVAAGWATYIPYGLGAAWGLWPRARLRLDGLDAQVVGVGAIGVFCANWIYLIAAGS